MELLTLLLGLLVSAVLCFYTWSSMYRPQNLPPGPIPLPVLGNLLQLKTGQMVDSLQQMHQKYGDVYTLYLGPRRVVVLCGYEAVKEALVDQGEDFGIRGHLPVVDLYFQGHGVAFSNGDRWKQMRRFSVVTLKNFGMRKRSIEERIKEETRCLMEEFRKTNGAPFSPVFYFKQAVSNIICSIVFGQRYRYGDADFRRLMQIIDDIFQSMSSFWGQLFDIFDKVLRHLPGPHHRTHRFLCELEEFVKERIEADKKTLNLDSPRHILDSFMIRMEEEKHNPSTHFTLKNLITNTLVLFVAGTEGISMTLRHAFLLLLKYPDIKSKVQEEIDRVIGRHRVPGPEDQPSMPYTQAVIHEIHRFPNVLPMNLPHAAAKDTEFRGFTIPKGTDVFPVLTSVLNDSKYFPDPYTFDPNRFLDENGSFKKNEAFMVFSAGIRVCPGEGIARLEIFLFLTILLQNFDITSPVAPEDLDISTQMVGFSNAPPPYEISFIPR
ncbi:cytochrome P450 2A5-like [Spea bombifrons]|uniref:cytochrome P450 2A5-like n=1 Tax=Spea bombifrons TaxID=233779 RepID=UPI00234AE664|nr:cytochrome P450 2A5-like [Spea bombifrons]